MYIRAMVIRIIALFFAIALSSLGNAQTIIFFYELNFDSTYAIGGELSYNIDTISNSNNIWEVAVPNKVFFDSASSWPNAILTDSISTYPINDTSSFTVLYSSQYAFDGNYNRVSISHKIDADSGKDYGLIEFSLDIGKTWINPFNEPSLRINDAPILDSIYTGTHDWTTLQFNFSDYFSQNLTSDSILFKFTFISDSIETNQEGWMIDDIIIYDGDVGVEEWIINFNSTIYPNPTEGLFNIDFDNSSADIFNIVIYDYSGKVMRRMNNFSPETKINVQDLSSGIYYYHIFSERSEKQSTAKFIIRK